MLESLRQENQELKGSLGDHKLQPVLTRVETLPPKPKKNKKERKEIKPLEMAKNSRIVEVPLILSSIININVVQCCGLRFSSSYFHKQL